MFARLNRLITGALGTLLLILVSLFSAPAAHSGHWERLHYKLKGVTTWSPKSGPDDPGFARWGGAQNPDEWVFSTNPHILLSIDLIGNSVILDPC